jgi:ABC-type Mn2+/Zn2+ transport system ATPase subunit
MASIRTAGLTKDFGDLRAVNEIDLDLPEGGVAGFVGPNGAGKSTTIRMLLGLIQPTRGDGEVLGHPIDRPAAYLHRLGSVDQQIPGHLKAPFVSVDVTLCPSVAIDKPGGGRTLSSPRRLHGEAREWAT